MKDRDLIMKLIILVYNRIQEEEGSHRGDPEGWELEAILSKRPPSLGDGSGTEFDSKNRR